MVIQIPTLKGSSRRYAEFEQMCLREFPAKSGKVLLDIYDLRKSLSHYNDIAQFYYECLYGEILVVPVPYKDNVQQKVRFIPGNYYDKKQYEPFRTSSLETVKEAIKEPIRYGPLPRVDTGEIRLMIIGKAPGANEEALGYNFVGPVGLDALAFLEFEDLFEYVDTVYLTNVVKWRVLVESEAYYKKFAKDCIPLLYNEIIIYEPDIIVYFGSKSVYQVVAEALNVNDHMQALGCFELRGNNKTVNGLIVASSFRFNNDDRLAINRLVGYISGKEIVRSDCSTDYCVLDDADVVRNVVDRFLEEGVENVAVDAEWFGRFGDNQAFLRIVQFAGYVNGRLEAYIVVLADEHGNGDKQQAEDKVRELARLLLNENVLVVGSFLYSDAVWLKKYGCDLSSKYEQTFFSGGTKGILDIAMAEAVIDETARLDLCSLAGKRLGMSAWDGDIVAWAKENRTQFFGHVPAAILFPYAVLDVKATLLLAKEYTKLLANDTKVGRSLYEPYVSNMAMCYALMEMLSVGVCVDCQGLEDLKKEFQLAYEKLLKDIRCDVNWPEFDPNKTRHIIAVLFGNKYLDKPILPETAYCCNLEPVKSTNKRYVDWSKAPSDIRKILTVSVDAESLGILSGRHPLVNKLRDLRFVKQALTTIFGTSGLGTHVADDGAVRSFIAPTTETGRCRSSRPNIQNFSNRRNADYARICRIKRFPSDCLKPRPGYKLIEMDFVAAELFLLGVMAGSELLVEHCRRSSLPSDHSDHYDLHSQIAVRAFRLPCKPTKEGLEAAGKKHFRVCAKAVVYGLTYGRGSEAIVRQVKAETGIDVTTAEVKAIKDAFMSPYPEIQSLLDQLRAVVYSPGYQVNYFGRIRRFKQINDDEFMAKQERESLNFAFQSMVADCLNRVAFYLMASDVKEELDYRLLIPIHDAILFEVNENYAECFVREYLPEVVALVRFGRWSPLGDKLTPPKYSLSVETKVKG